MIKTVVELQIAEGELKAYENEIEERRALTKVRTAKVRKLKREIEAYKKRTQKASKV